MKKICVLCLLVIVLLGFSVSSAPFPYPDDCNTVELINLEEKEQNENFYFLCSD